MIPLSLICTQLQTIPGLTEMVDFPAVSRFIRLAASLKPTIIQSQVHTFNPNTSYPLSLPRLIAKYISDKLVLPLEHTDGLWSALGMAIWEDGEMLLGEDIGEAWRFHGHLEEKESLGYRMLYPPTSMCNQVDCGRVALLRRKDKPRKVVLFTLDRGVCDAYSVHLYCERCHSNYHHNFVVRRNVRTYYAGLPDTIQVSEHHFVERRVLDLFTSLSLFSWTSATNAAHIYHHSLSQLDEPLRSAARYHLRTEQVWDGFVVLALLKDARDRHYVLEVPHCGDQKDRFKMAMEARNDHMNRCGQPEFMHYCEKCTRRLDRGDGGEAETIDVVVTDGIEMGRPCCSVRHCTEVLVSTQDRYCPSHAHLGKLCVVTGCGQHAEDGHRTCAAPQHRSIEEWHVLHGKAMFHLRHTLLRAHQASSVEKDTSAAAVPITATLPTNSNPDDTEVDSVLVEDDLDLCDDGEQESDHIAENAPASSNGLQDGQAEVVPSNACPDKPEVTPRSMRTMFTRRRTHNEQILVRPCGMILKRATFFGSETTPQVLDFVRKTFPTCDLMPNILVYDNNCGLYKHSKASGETLHEEIGLPVDVFHWKSKHKKTDEVCSVHCNPYTYPDLRIDDKGNWFFNTSIAEQTNVWLGGYAAIVREMTSIKYDFFLDEMIKEKNRLTREKLLRNDCLPNYRPYCP
ncbi:hypothetical protein OH77DRAFT_1449458 [Trametes cingulata]|nr:hypothetical protein OH77DRAFT_1449458 [Trametes cingulata]